MVVLAAGFGGWRYVENRQAAEKSEFESLIKLARSLSFQKKYEEAATQLKNYIDDSPKKEYVFEATIQLGSAYLNWGKYQEALTTFRAADELKGPNPLAATVGIALAAERLGDKATAVESYKKAIEILRLKGDDSFIAQEIRHYEQQISELESQP